MNERVKTNGIIPNSAWGLILMLILLIAEIGFGIIMAAVDVLPGKYVVAVIAILLAVDVVSAILLCGKRKTPRRITGIILSIVMILALFAGIYYLYNMYDTMQKISADAGQWDEYYVVVSKDSRYDDIDQIRGKTVWTIDNNSKMQKEAMGKLQTEAEVEYDFEPDFMSTAKHLVNKKEGVATQVILTSESRYEMMKEEIDNFGKLTKIIYKIPVAIPSDNNARKIDVTEDSFNVYISGSDARGDINEVARTDVNMIVTVNPKTRTVLLTSIPRDAYVPLHMNGEMDKLTHTGVYGIKETLGTVEDWLGIEMNYHVRVGFQMVVDLVDAVDGVDVYSNKKFKSAVAPFYYEKGWNHCNGKKALYFVRERKAFGSKDSIRVKNQQKVMKALIKKVTSSRTLLMNYTDILNAVKASMQTDLSKEEMSRLVKMQLNDMSKWRIKKQTIDGYYTQKGTWSMGPGRPLDVYITDGQSVEKCKKKIQQVMYPLDESQ